MGKEVTVSVNTPLGLCDVRLVNEYGVSNARASRIGDLPGVAEVEPNNERATSSVADSATTSPSSASPLSACW